MKIPNATRFWIITIAIVIGITALAAPSRQNRHLNNQKASDAQDAQKVPEDNPGPIVDYDENYNISSVKDPKERAFRQARGSRYDKRESFPLGKFPPDMTQYARDIHWGMNIPALPSGQSDAVVIGEVTDAKAYLSNDKSGVYSEFSIRVEQVLKGQAASSLNPDSSIIAEREGGVVRFDSGHLLRYKVWHQGLPRIGHKYVFFLQNNADGNDYLIVTGYDIRNERVFPLDGQGEAEGKYLSFAKYENFDKESFLNAVREAITNPPRLPDAKRRWDR